MPGFLFAHSSVESGMRWLLKRWYVWLVLFFLLMGIAESASLIYRRHHRLTQENFDRIQEGMAKDDVVDILGLDYEYRKSVDVEHGDVEWCSWFDGPDCIHLRFFKGKLAYVSAMYCATPSKAMKWYLRRGLEKIGICWEDPPPPIPIPDPRPSTP
jgi:hypothetical protein